MKQSRPVLCMNCSNWAVAPNVEQGTCTIDQDGEVYTNNTAYDTRCLLGLSESVEKPEVEVSFKKHCNREDDKRTLYFTIRNESTESGMFSRAYYEFKDMFKDDPIEAQEVLRGLIVENVNDEYIMEGVLHLLHEFEYEEMDLINKYVIEVCWDHKSNIVKEKLISVFENWKTTECLEALLKMTFATKWLADYQLQVIEDLKEK